MGTLGDYPVYVRAGALIPLVKDTKVSNIIPDSADRKTMFTWFAPTAAADVNNKATFELRQSVTEGTGITATAYFSSATTIEATISATKSATGFEIVGINEPSNVDLDSWLLSGCAYVYVDHIKTLSVSCLHTDGGVAIHIEGVTSSVF
eukprot:NODE_2147_length_667_cov_79.498382_g1811_i0.p1 GENE.NODE_2147_length_667_cov_79.498382_g1811_i0~~NODE_2147_length_667_cov_79.498382_g1811_i0.p1  ORF type:complete len:169 (+),score=40.82 NODE_2147_length_667_cov_79.498382_g1811_i0:62-508(+)